MTMIGALGLLQTVVDFAGEDVICAMMSGVGIILAKAAMDLVKDVYKRQDIQHDRLPAPPVGFFG